MQRNSVLEKSITQALKPCNHIGSKVFCFDALESTMDLAKQYYSNSPDGCKMIDGTMIIADSQTDGRGRYQRKWHSPKGGLWISYFLYNPIQHNPGLRENPAALSFAAALSMQEILGQYVDCSIKWVNDILCNRKKIGGVLIEGDQNYQVVGIGLNTNVDDFDAVLEGDGVPDLMKGKNLVDIATSVQLETGKEIDNVEAAIILSKAFDRAYSLIKQNDFSSIFEKYRALCDSFGKGVDRNVVVYKRNINIFDGIPRNIDSKGRLIVEKQNGRLVSLVDEEIFYI